MRKRIRIKLLTLMSFWMMMTRYSSMKNDFACCLICTLCTQSKCSWNLRTLCNWIVNKRVGANYTDIYHICITFMCSTCINHENDIVQSQAKIVFTWPHFPICLGINLFLNTQAQMIHQNVHNAILHHQISFEDHDVNLPDLYGVWKEKTFTFDDNFLIYEYSWLCKLAHLHIRRGSTKYLQADTRFVFLACISREIWSM